MKSVIWTIDLGHVVPGTLLSVIGRINIPSRVDLGTKRMFNKMFLFKFFNTFCEPERVCGRLKRLVKR